MWPLEYMVYINFGKWFRTDFKTQYLLWIVANNSRNSVFDIASIVLENRLVAIILSAFFSILPLISLHSFFHKNIVFPVKTEFSYFSADFRLEIFLWHDINISVIELEKGRILYDLVKDTILLYFHFVFKFSIEHLEERLLSRSVFTVT